MKYNKICAITLTRKKSRESVYFGRYIPHPTLSSYFPRMNPSLALIESGPELMLIMFIVLLLFGPKKLPELAKGLGKSMREFKKAANDVESEIRRAMDEPEAPIPTKFPPYPPARPTIAIADAPPEQAPVPPTPPPSVNPDSHAA